MPTDMPPERLEEIAKRVDWWKHTTRKNCIMPVADAADLIAALRESREREAAALRDSRRLDHLDKIKLYKSPSYGYNGDKYSIYLDGGLDHNGSGEALSLFGAIDRDMEKRNAG